MFDALGKWFAHEMIKHPALVLLGMMLGVLMLVYVGPAVFVLADDFDKYQDTTSEKLNAVEVEVKKLGSGLCELKYSGDVNSLEQKMAATETEIFQLLRKESAGQIHPLEIERLDQQRYKLKQLERELADVKRNPCPSD